jgi:hypothetical protein
MRLRTLEVVERLGYTKLRNDHLEDYRPLFSHVDFHLGCDAAIKSPAAKSTGELMK